MSVDLLRNLQPGRVRLDDVMLDPNNPRLFDVRKTTRRVPDERIGEQTVQEDTFSKMFDGEHDVKPLMDSIAEVGFLPVDKVVVRALPGGKYVVVEGNRRITALKALKKEYEAGEMEIDGALKATFDGIDVLVLGSSAEDAERDQWVLQGLRHLSGIKSWGLYQQAKAIEVLIDQVGLDAREASECVGLSTNRVNRLYRALGAFHQMQEDDDYGPKVLPDMFSYFEEVIKRPAIKDTFLGFDDEARTFANQENLAKFYSWIVPSDDLNGEKKIPRAIDVRLLEKVVASSDAMRILESPESNIYDAARRADPEETFDWESAIRDAMTALDNIPASDLEAMSEEKHALIEDLISKAKTRLDQVSQLRNRK